MKFLRWYSIKSIVHVYIFQLQPHVFAQFFLKMLKKFQIQYQLSCAVFCSHVCLVVFYFEKVLKHRKHMSAFSRRREISYSASNRSSSYLQNLCRFIMSFKSPLLLSSPLFPSKTLLTVVSSSTNPFGIASVAIIMYIYIGRSSSIAR